MGRKEEVGTEELEEGLGEELSWSAEEQDWEALVGFEEEPLRLVLAPCSQRLLLVSPWSRESWT